MNRRSFLTVILATCTAPAIVRASSLMPVVARSSILSWPMLFAAGDEVPDWLMRVESNGSTNFVRGLITFVSPVSVTKEGDHYRTRALAPGGGLIRVDCMHNATLRGQSPPGCKGTLVLELIHEHNYHTWGPATGRYLAKEGPAGVWSSS